MRGDAPVFEPLKQGVRRLVRAPPCIALQLVEPHERGRFPDPATVLPVQAFRAIVRIQPRAVTPPLNEPAARQAPMKAS